MRAIRVYVLRDSLGDCTNGGASGRHDTLLLAHPRGFVEVDGDDERLFEVGMTAGGFPCLEPVNGGKGIGPMAGGNYAASSDARFGELIQQVTGTRFYGAVAIHDRYETVAQYEALSR